MIDEIDKQLEEMEDELARLANALEVINNSKQATEKAAATLNSVQESYSKASKSAAQALQDCSEQLSSSSSQLLSKIDPLVSEIKNSELGKCNDNIQKLEEIVEKEVMPRIRKLATNEQLKASESSCREALQAIEEKDRRSSFISARRPSSRHAKPGSGASTTRTY